MKTREEQLAEVERLKSILSPSVLKTYADMANLYGWHGDYYEVVRFLDFIHEMHDGEEFPREMLDPEK